VANAVWPKPIEADKRSTAISEIRLMEFPLQIIKNNQDND